MSRHVRLRELLVGVEGLALLRHLYDGSDEDAAERIDEVSRIVTDTEFTTGEFIAETDAREGYDAWSSHYDGTDNPVIELEEPVVWSILASIPPGRALDVACGTGRHAGKLVTHGHSVVGVDYTRAMLSVARRELPSAVFAEADLLALPLADDAFNIVVCGLALAHVAQLAHAIAELARVLAPGGRLVVSALHPFQAMLGWHAPFESIDGKRGFVREHAHTHAEYLAGFAAAGLVVRACVEPGLTYAQVRSKRRAFRHIPTATAAAYVGLPGVLVWDAGKPIT